MDRASPTTPYPTAIVCEHLAEREGNLARMHERRSIERDLEPIVERAVATSLAG